MYETDREVLVETLKKKGIEDKKVLEAFLKVERHRFVSEAMIHLAYEDSALPIGYNQTISQPYTVAFMTEALNVKPGADILEIGTGSGYQAAILNAMGCMVYTIERNEKLYKKTCKLFDELGIELFRKCGDGTLGWNEYAPFDGIVVTAGAPTIPKILMEQLKIGGTLVIPVGDKKKQSMQVITRTDDQRFNYSETPHFAFVPLIGKDGWKS